MPFRTALAFFCLGLCAARAWCAEPADPRFQAAIQDFSAGRFRESEAALERLVKEDPKKALYWFNLGNARFQLQSYPDAIRAYVMVQSLGSKLAPAAALYQVKALRASGRNGDAAKKLQPLLADKTLPPGISSAIEAEADSLQKEMLDKGLELYRARSYAAAESLLSQAAALRENPDAQMMLGLAAIRDGHPDEARNAFAVVQAKSANAEHKGLAKDILAQIREGTYEAKPYWAYLDGAIGYDTNVFSVGSNVGPTAEPGTELQAGAGARLVQQRHFHLSAAYHGLYDEVFGQPTLRFIVHALSVPLNVSQGSWALFVVPQYRIEFLGGDEYERDISGTITAQKSFGEHDVGLRFTATRYDPGSAIYSYLDGSSTILRPYWVWNLSRGYVSAAYSYNRALIGDFVSTTSTLPLANHSSEISASGGWDFAGPWSLEGALRYAWISYTNLAQPDNFLRNDKVTDIFAKLSYRLRPGLKLYFSNELVLNGSNLGESNTVNKNYTQNISYAGMSWDIL